MHWGQNNSAAVSFVEKSSEVQNILTIGNQLFGTLVAVMIRKKSELVDCVGKLVWSSWTYYKDIVSCLQESHAHSTIDTSVCCPWYSMWEEFTSVIPPIECRTVQSCPHNPKWENGTKCR